MDTQNPVPDQAPTHDIVLKPCPFCGGAADWDNEDAPGSNFIQCTACEARTGWFREVEDAEEAWNHRAPDEESLWRFWNDKAREQGKQIGDLRTQVFLLEKQVADLHAKVMRYKYHYDGMLKTVRTLAPKNAELEKQVADLTAELERLHYEMRDIEERN